MKQRIVVVLGTRPEIIRLSLIVKKLKENSEVKVVYTNQNWQIFMKDFFIEELGLEPDFEFDLKGNSTGSRVGEIISKSESYFKENQPSKVVILGDTDSGVCSYIAERMQIPTFHIEAGNRSYSDKSPEEINRKMIDHVSSFNLPYTPNSKNNLIKEGIETKRIFQCGNPIYEVMLNTKIKSDITKRMKLKNFILATLHRSETVDKKETLKEALIGISETSKQLGMPVVLSLHPRTRNKIKEFKLECEVCDTIIQHDPFSFSEFLELEKSAKLILTDSGTVSEEACILGVPTVIVRDFTERPELVLCGSAVVSTIQHDRILESSKLMIKARGWEKPYGYLDTKVSDKIAQYVLTTFK